VTGPEPVVSAEPEQLSGSAEPGASGATGHPAVDAALDELAQAAELPPGEQVPAYEAVHRTLSQTLATIDQS
jgi:hypothetical protein